MGIFDWLSKPKSNVDVLNDMRLQLALHGVKTACIQLVSNASVVLHA
jgi:hypothetical protein